MIQQLQNSICHKEKIDGGFICTYDNSITENDSYLFYNKTVVITNIIIDNGDDVYQDF